MDSDYDPDDVVYESLLKEAEIFGLCLYGDGATVKRMPLINVLGSGRHGPSEVPEIHNCTKQLEERCYVHCQHLPSYYGKARPGSCGHCRPRVL